MKTALIFPGQASQVVGMGRDLYESFSLAKEMFETANNILGFDLANICFTGPLQDLTQTRVTQPALFVVSSILSKLLKDNNFGFTAAAGHSLGEYSALYANGTFSFEDGLKLVKLRAESMQKAGEDNPGTMAAILNLEIEKIQEACDKAKDIGIVNIANYNSPKQIAISGEVEAVQSAMQYAKDLGAKRAIQLEVSGAFHSPLMGYASGIMKKALGDTELNKPSIPVYANVDAKPTKSRTKIKQNLIDQIENAVLWTQTIETMKKDGFEKLIEVGPGKVLQGLVKRIDSNLTLEGISNVTDLEALGIL